MINNVLRWFEMWSGKRKSTSTENRIRSYHRPLWIGNPTIQQRLLLNLRCNHRWMRIHQVNPQPNKVLLSLVKHQKQNLRTMFLLSIRICLSMQTSELHPPNLLLSFSSQFLPPRYCNNAKNISTSASCNSQTQSKRTRGRKRKNSIPNEQDEATMNHARKENDQRLIPNSLPLDDITNLNFGLRQSKRKRRSWLKYSK